METAAHSRRREPLPIRPRVRRRYLSLVWATACAGSLVALGSPSVIVSTPPTQGFTFTAAGDYGSGPATAATLDGIGQSGAAFHLALGDFSYSNEPESSWCGFVTDRVRATFPFLLVAGNHEDDFGGNGHIADFAACLPGRVPVEGRYGTQYYFDYAGLARFILISPGLTIDGEHHYYGDANAHYVWLADAIDGARQAGLPWVIVGMHQNCISLGSYYCNIYSNLMDLLLEKKVDLTLHAHDHTYQRTRQLALGPDCRSLPIDAFDADCVVGDGTNGTYVRGSGTLSVIVGTAGRPLYDVNTNDPEAGYFAAWMGANVTPRHGFVRLSVSDQAIEGRFVGSTDTSSFSDHFRIQ